MGTIPATGRPRLRRDARRVFPSSRKGHASAAAPAHSAETTSPRDTQSTWHLPRTDGANSSCGNGGSLRRWTARDHWRSTNSEGEPPHCARVRCCAACGRAASLRHLEVGRIEVDRRRFGSRADDCRRKWEIRNEFGIGSGRRQSRLLQKLTKICRQVAS